MLGVQLLLNAAWSAIFFGWHQPGWALLEMGVAGSGRSVAGDRDHDYAVQTRLGDRCHAADSLPRVGQFCRRFEFRFLVAELAAVF